MIRPNFEVTQRNFRPWFDEGRHHRAKIGFVLLATEQTVESDAMRLCPRGVGMHFTRAAIPDSITSETLAAQADILSDCAATLLPDGSLDVVAYGCTSGSLVIGEERVFAEFAKGAPGAIPTSIITSVIRALKAVDAKRIVVGTPYIDELNSQEEFYLTGAGFEVLDIQGLGLEKDSDMVRVSPDCLRDFAFSLDRADADAIFISCSALRTLDVLQEIEKWTNKPCIASNPAMIWDTLRLAGVNDPILGCGRLLAHH